MIKIFWLEKDKEKSITISPKDVPEMKWENGFDLYLYGLTQVCNHFNCLPEDLKASWCFDFIPVSDINPDLSWKEKCNQIYNTEDYQYWYQLKRESLACRAADSMFSDAYKYLIEACKHHEECVYERDFEDVDEYLTNRAWKEPFWAFHLFELVGLQSDRVDTGAWIFRDGSYITVDAGNHRRIVEGYMGLKEAEIERSWVKIQLYWAYTHENMTDAQKKTLNKFFKKYESLYESDKLWTEYKKTF